MDTALHQTIITTMPRILICGGSLAGLACAIRLKQFGHDPITLEKCKFPRRKLCGEFLGPDAMPLLRILGLHDAVHEQAFGPVEKTLFYNRRGQVVTIQHAWIQRHQPYALAIPRDVLDTLLLRHARQLGLQCLEQQRVLSPIQRANSLFMVETETVGAEHEQDRQTFETDILIDATGRSGKLSVLQPAQQNTIYRNRIGVQCHVKLGSPPEHKDLSMFLFQGGYGGIQPIGTNTANVCMMMNASLAKSMHGKFNEFIQATIGQNPAAAEYLSKSCRISEFCTTSDINLAGITPQPHTGPNALIQIGDAYITVDPFTGSGMAHALETGIMAAEIVHEGIQNNQTYACMQSHYQATYQRHFQTRLRFMHAFRPFLESEHLQDIVWPLLPPFLPLLAKLFR